LASFDSVIYDVIRDTKVSAWEDVTKTEVWPRGSTPLNDSVVRLVNRCLEDNPKKAVLVVMTDGEENCSREIRTRKQVQDVIKLATNKGYESVFLGANFDGIDAETQSYGVAATRSVFVRPENLRATFDSLATKTVNYMSAQSQSVGASTMDFADHEKDEAAKPKAT
jgi:hypothetical protein